MNSKKATVRYFRQWPHHEPHREEAKGCERENHRHRMVAKAFGSRCLSFLHNLDYEHTNGIFANIYSTTDVNNANAAPKMPKTMGK